MIEKKKITSYKDLEVWKKGIVLVKNVYSLTNKFPSSELYGLTSQIRRSVVSVPANIAEGWGRESSKNFVQFLKVSRGSLYELDTILTIATETNLITEKEKETINNQIEEQSKMLNSLIRKINSSS